MDLSSWTPRPTPGLAPLEGRLVRLEPFDRRRHGAGLFAAVGGEANAGIWTHMPVGPFPTPDSIAEFLEGRLAADGWRSMMICGQTSGEVLGMAAYMRIREAHGSAEIGCVAFGPKLQRTPEATEAFALMARHVFELGYRRYEWKCNQQNEPSKRAAVRFGFVFEGIFRNDMVMKGRSRDTAWYSITDEDWPKLDKALVEWLAPSNFGPPGPNQAGGLQLRTLESFRK